ncbi:MAG: LacI family transcriptional regulator [Spirochaetaceae bacterium]|jgi:LacI family transcriptional regulator|nr:LacI family transcriptional regulator [Spirochaetaceae bacterium]
MGKTIRDVAALAGVSTATVSRVLAPGVRQVTEGTRIRVLKAAETLEYRTNFIARSLKTRSTMTVALIIPELANNFFMDVAEGIEEKLISHGYTMLLASSGNSMEVEKRRIAMLEDRGVDGMVVIPASSRGDHLQAVADRGIPVILVDRLAEGAKLDAIASDNEKGAFELTRALFADGYRRVAFVGGDITVSSARERLSGFARALAEAGIVPGPDLLYLGGMEVEDGYRRMKAILESSNPPEAMVAVNLLVHLGMERCLLGARARAVIAGFDTSEYVSFLPACRYIATQNAVEMGRSAGAKIIEGIGEKKSGAFRKEKSGGRITRLPVTIIRQEEEKNDSKPL